MSDRIDSLRFLGAIAAALGLIRLLMTLGKELRDALDALGVGRDKHPSIYEIWFWAFIAALVGGFVWGIIWKQSVGGDNKEPHGVWAVLWPVLSLLPVLLALAFLNRKYHLVSWTAHVGSHSIWLLGAILGAWLFYDLPLGGGVGFRGYMLSRTPTYAEFWLVFIWSALLALPGFVFLIALRSLSGVSFTMERLLTELIRPVGLVVVITSMPVLMFLLAYPDRIKFEQARGIIAGVMLRMTLFISLFLVTRQTSSAPPPGAVAPNPELQRTGFARR